MDGLQSAIVFLSVLVATISGYFILEAFARTTGPTGLPGTASVIGPTGPVGSIGPVGIFTPDQKPVCSVAVLFSEGPASGAIFSTSRRLLANVPLQLVSGRQITSSSSRLILMRLATPSPLYFLDPV